MLRNEASESLANKKGMKIMSIWTLRNDDCCLILHDESKVSLLYIKITAIFRVFTNFKVIENLNIILNWFEIE